MATETKPTPTDSEKSHEATHHNSPQVERLKLVASKIKGHSFGIFLFVAGLITVFALWAVGLQSNINQWSPRIGLIVGLYSFAIMVYPAFLALTTSHFRVARLAVMTVAVVVPFFILPFLVRLLGGIGTELWEVTFIGPVLLPIAAVVLTAITAGTLARYPEEAKSSKELAAEKSDLTEKRQSLADDHDKAQRAFEATRSREVLLKGEATELESRSTSLQHELETATAELDTLPQRADIAQLETDIKAIDAKIANLEKTIVEHEAFAGSATGKERAKYISDIAALERHMTKLTEERTKHEQRITKLTRELASDSKQQRVDSLKEQTDAAIAERNAHQPKLEDAIAQRERAEATLVTSGSALEKIDADIAQSSAKATAAKKDTTGLLRSLLFWSLGPLVASFVLYSTWYGWKLAAF